MAVLGRGEGHGGLTILHALGAGYGSAIGITFQLVFNYEILQ